MLFGIGQSIGGTIYKSNTATCYFEIPEGQVVKVQLACSLSWKEKNTSRVPLMVEGMKTIDPNKIDITVLFELPKHYSM